MHILIERTHKGKGFTLGVMKVNSKKFCATLEPEEHQGLTNTMSPISIQNIKHIGKTAIPTGGGYEIRHKWNPQLACFMPKVINVPGFSGIYFLEGTEPKHTTGSILLGRCDEDGVPRLTNSKLYVDIFRDLVADADKIGEKVELEIR